MPPLLPSRLAGSLPPAPAVLQRLGQCASLWTRAPPAGRPLLQAGSSSGGHLLRAASKPASPAARQPDRRNGPPPSCRAALGIPPVGRRVHPPRHRPSAATDPADTAATQSVRGHRHCSVPAPSQCYRRRRQRITRAVLPRERWPTVSGAFLIEGAPSAWGDSFQWTHSSLSSTMGWGRPSPSVLRACSGSVPASPPALGSTGPTGWEWRP